MSEPRPIVAVAISAALSALPSVGGPLQTVFDAIEERQRFRAEQTAREIGQLVGEDALVARLADNPELETVLAQALTAATLTGLEAKRKLLARAAAAAFSNDEKVDPAILVVLALAQLEPVLIRALARLVEVSDRDREAGDERKTAIEQAQEDISIPIRATLIQTGVAIPATSILGGGVRVYDVSDFGRELLRQLKEVADEDSERVGH